MVMMKPYTNRIYAVGENCAATAGKAARCRPISSTERVGKTRNVVYSVFTKAREVKRSRLCHEPRL